MVYLTSFLFGDEIMNIEEEIVDLVLFLYPNKYKGIKGFNPDVEMLNDIIKNIQKRVRNFLINNAHEVISFLTNYILIPNFFDKDEIEALIDEEISDKEFTSLVKRWNEYGNWDKISDIVREFVIRNLYKKDF